MPARLLHPHRRVTVTPRRTNDFEQALAVTREQIEESLADPNGGYRRLRRVMDAWCALWYWPLTEPDIEPPTLDEWLKACSELLGVAPDRKHAWMDTFGSATDWTELGIAEESDLNLSGAQPVSRVLAKFPWLDVCERVAGEQGFFHWELDFATVFARGGFDLQVGNPPWVRPRSDVESLLAEGDPWWAVALKPSEAAKRERREIGLADPVSVQTVTNGTTETMVLAELLSDSTVYPKLSGQPDLYRAFMSQVWTHASPAGIAALIHYETHFTDDKAQILRRESYRRLRRHWQFANELKLFDIQNQKPYGINVYGASRQVAFLHGTSLYHPDTVARSFNHDGSGPEPGIKDPSGQWDLRPHKTRIQRVDGKTLRIWQDILESPDWESTPMVYIVNSTAARVLATLSESVRIGSHGLEYSRGWDESTDRKKGRFESKWGVASWRDAILIGTHLQVANPFNKWPNPTMRNHRDTTPYDLEALSAASTPTTPYKPSGDRALYDATYTQWGIDKVSARDFYRVAWRRRAANTGERTLMPAIIPPGTAHVHGINSAGSPPSATSLAIIAGALSTIIIDFFIRSAPKADILPRTLERQPMVPFDHPLINSLAIRSLRLNCVTDAYADLWDQCWSDEFRTDAPILERFDDLPVSAVWTTDTPLRRAVDRRDAQVEIDALVALMLGVRIDDLCTIYRTQFGVLYSYDRALPNAPIKYYYDAHGRLVPNSVLTVWRKKGDAITQEERTATHPGSGVDYVYELPFATRDREADFRTAYSEFERRLAAKEARS